MTTHVLEPLSELGQNSDSEGHNGTTRTRMALTRTRPASVIRHIDFGNLLGISLPILIVFLIIRRQTQSIAKEKS